MNNGYFSDICACVCVCVYVRVRASVCLCVHVFPLCSSRLYSCLLYLCDLVVEPSSNLSTVLSLTGVAGLHYHFSQDLCNPLPLQASLQPNNPLPVLQHSPLFSLPPSLSPSLSLSLQ